MSFFPPPPPPPPPPQVEAISRCCRLSSAAHTSQLVTSTVPGCPSLFDMGLHLSPPASWPGAWAGVLVGWRGADWGSTTRWGSAPDKGGSAAPHAAHSLQLKERGKATEKPQPRGDHPKTNPAFGICQEKRKFGICQGKSSQGKGTLWLQSDRRRHVGDGGSCRGLAVRLWTTGRCRQR